MLKDKKLTPQEAAATPKQVMFEIRCVNCGHWRKPKPGGEYGVCQNGVKVDHHGPTERFGCSRWKEVEKV